MFSFAIDYYLFVFGASVGVIQVAVSLGSLKGLLIVKPPIVARVGGLALAVASFVWFFATETRNINDFEGGLDAPSQVLFFFLGALSALLATLIVSSLVNAGLNGDDSEPTGGLDALKSSNYGRALTRSLRYWWREWRTQTKPYFFG